MIILDKICLIFCNNYANLYNHDTLIEYMLSISKFDYNIINLNFRQKGRENSSNPQVNSANQFIMNMYDKEEKRIRGNFAARYFGSPTALWGGTGVVLLGELLCLAKFYTNKKSKFPTPKLKNEMCLILGGALALGISFSLLVQNWQNKIINKKSTKPQEFLEKYGNDTSAKLSKKNFRSLLIVAQYNPINGVIEINKNYIHDPIGGKMIEKYIKHELQHARQYEMIAGLDNGLEKLNFASISPIVQYARTNSFTLAIFKEIIKNIKKNDTQGLYENVQVPISGACVNLKKYIQALDIMINNPHAKPEDIPMLIDVEHYKKALAKRGPLSKEEKIKAEEYYQAALKYPLMTGLNLINPFSGYRSNILEKEARQASRSK